MVLYTTAKAGNPCDLKQMKIDVDTINKKLVITELPRAEIKIYPDEKFTLWMIMPWTDSDQKSINGIMESAKQKHGKKCWPEELEQEGHEQLVHNLNDILFC